MAAAAAAAVVEGGEVEVEKGRALILSERPCFFSCRAAGAAPPLLAPAPAAAEDASAPGRLQQLLRAMLLLLLRGAEGIFLADERLDAMPRVRASERRNTHNRHSRPQGELESFLLLSCCMFFSCPECSRDDASRALRASTKRGLKARGGELRSSVHWGVRKTSDERKHALRPTSQPWL